MNFTSRVAVRGLGLRAQAEVPRIPVLGHGGPSHIRFALVAVIALFVVGCSTPDPYKRLEVTPPSVIGVKELSDAFNSRWPERFKCTQTVVIDFGPVTKTFVGYLAVERPGRFRLQGMTEQGVKMFDLAHNEKEGDVVVLAATDELKEQALKSISRDIQRVFFERQIDYPYPIERLVASHDGRYQYLEFAHHHYGDQHVDDRNRSVRVRLVGNNAKVDSYEAWNVGWLFRVDQYEWDAEKTRPTVIVLRDSGRGSFPYTLTVKITDFKVVDKPFPEKTFFPNQ